jgi:CDP-diacylglycerol---serine O-phosphatidyltransferase
MTTPPRRRLRLNPRSLPLRRSLFLLPNLVTLSSVFCGFYSIGLSATARADSEFQRAALLIVFAMFFDTMDGRVARLTKTQSSFGLQFDSLADVVSFGVAPAVLVYHRSLAELGFGGVLAAFVFVACGAIRLARFNVLSMDTTGAPVKPSKYIVGLPIPGAAGIVVSLVVASGALQSAFGRGGYGHILLGATLGLGALMVSTVRFRSFKDLRLNLRSLLVVGLCIGSSIVIYTQLQPAFALVWLLGMYVLLGIVEWIVSVLQRLRARPAPQGSTTPPGTSE